jgi:hypothetical protein
MPIREACIFESVILNKVKDPRTAEISRAVSSFSISNRFWSALPRLRQLL